MNDENYRAQADIEDAVMAAMAAGYTFQQFFEQARELWASMLARDAQRVRYARIEGSDHG